MGSAAPNVSDALRIFGPQVRANFGWNIPVPTASGSLVNVGILTDTDSINAVTPQIEGVGTFAVSPLVSEPLRYYGAPIAAHFGWHVHNPSAGPGAVVNVGILTENDSINSVNPIQSVVNVGILTDTDSIMPLVLESITPDILGINSIGSIVTTGVNSSNTVSKTGVNSKLSVQIVGINSTNTL